MCEMDMKRFFPMAIAAGTLSLTMGVGVYTFLYAKGASYLTDDPRACANCHIMKSEFDGWIASSHRSVATCNDCHTPPGFIPKYFTKALNGFRHSLAFTTLRFHEPIQITNRNRQVTEQACRKCHADIVQEIEGPHEGPAPLACLHCHATVGH